MEFDSTLDRSVSATGTVPVGEERVGSNPEQETEQELEQGNGTRTSQASISAALAANAGLHSTLASPVRFPGEDGGRSLAEMAQSDLDAALQLLAARAQYITGANGAAIALRRSGKNDMMCRASTGANVPELGALLSTEFGLSGESVRTRKALRCDDAERDPRVNREGCRELGIASVVVMPVVNDDEVLGVFELFSGRVNAFGERDLSALQRLSHMVETAVKLARAAENVAGVPVAEAASSDGLDDDVLEMDEPVLEVEAEPVGKDKELVTSGTEALTDKEGSNAALEVLNRPRTDSTEIAASQLAEEVELAAAAPEGASDFSALTRRLKASPDTNHEFSRKLSAGNSEAAVEPSVVAPAPAAEPPVVVQAVNTPPTALPREMPANPTAQTPLPKKPLFWSAAPIPSVDAEKPAESDQSHVPPGLRNLRSCEACGFPVSPGRSLCVECEEKRWRGQLKRPAAPLQSASSVASTKSPLLAKDARNGAPGSAEPPSGPVARLVAAAAAAATPGSAGPNASAAEVVSTSAIPATRPTIPDGRVKESKEVAGPPPAAVVAAKSPSPEPTSAPAREASETASPAFVLSAGLEPSQSWISANKYMVGALLVVAAVVAAIVFLR